MFCRFLHLPSEGQNFGPNLNNPSLTLPSQGFVQKGSNIFPNKSILGGKYEIKLKLCTTLMSECKFKANFLQQTCAA